jgi:hypothetical protein
MNDSNHPLTGQFANPPHKQNARIESIFCQEMLKMQIDPAICMKTKDRATNCPTKKRTFTAIDVQLDGQKRPRMHILRAGIAWEREWVTSSGTENVQSWSPPASSQAHWR